MLDRGRRRRKERNKIKKTKTSYLIGLNKTKELTMAFFFLRSIVCLKITFVFVVFPETGGWATTGRGYSGQCCLWSWQKKCPFCGGGGGRWRGAFQLRHKGKGKDSRNYSTADSLQSEYGAPATQPFVEPINVRNAPYFLFPPNPSLTPVLKWEIICWFDFFF